MATNNQTFYLCNGAEGVEKESKLQAADIMAAESSERVVSTYDCPVCRKAQILDLDRLLVSSALWAAWPSKRCLPD